MRRSAGNKAEEDICDIGMKQQWLVKPTLTHLALKSAFLHQSICSRYVPIEDDRAPQVAAGEILTRCETSVAAD